MNTNPSRQNLEEQQQALQKHKRTKLVILLALAGCLILLLLCTLIPGLLGESGDERETAAPVDPSKLHETKEEDFDIFEYDEYLKYDRTVYLYDPAMSMKIGISDKTLAEQNDGFILLYELLHRVMEGDSDAYNKMVTENLQKKNGFTQQQLYDILITKYSYGDKKEGDAVYTEYVFLLEYKIHENNGSFRNTIEPDACRPQYFVINDSKGKLLVMDVIDVLPKK